MNSKLPVETLPIRPDMADSYFELLTGQQGLPEKMFDPLEELKRLRQRLALRLQNPDSTILKHSVPEHSKESFFEYTVTEAKSSPVEPASSESVVEKMNDMRRTMKRTLSIWQRSRSRPKISHTAVFREPRKFRSKKRDIQNTVDQYLVVPREGILELINAGLTALGVASIVFGFLSFFRGWESDLSLGSLVCFSGATIMTIGLGGNFIASRADVQ